MVRWWQSGLLFMSWVLLILLGLWLWLTVYMDFNWLDFGRADTVYTLHSNEQAGIWNNYHPTMTHEQVIAAIAQLDAHYTRELWDGAYPLIIAILVLIVAIPTQWQLLIRRGCVPSPNEAGFWQSSIYQISWMSFILLSLCSLSFVLGLYTWTGAGRYEDYAYERKMITTNEQAGAWNNNHPTITPEQANAQRAQLDVLYRRELWDRSPPLVIALLVLAVALLIQRYLLTRRHHPPPAFAVQVS